jgi:hypothetical protein
LFNKYRTSRDIVLVQQSVEWNSAVLQQHGSQSVGIRILGDRRLDVLTKAADIQKRRAIYQRKTVWFPLKPVSAVVEPVEMDDEEDSTTDDEDTTTRTGPPPATREVCPLVHVGSRRASRRFNVLTKASVAKARMGKPGHGAKTGWFPLNTASNVVIFSLPDERSSLAEHTGVHR